MFKGYRKIIALVILVAIAVFLATKGNFNKEISDFLKWIYGIFALGNSVEHIVEKYELAKRKNTDSVNNSSLDELKKSAEDEIRNK